MPNASRTRVPKRATAPLLVLFGCCLGVTAGAMAQAAPIPTPPPAPVEVRPADTAASPTGAPNADAETTAAEAEFLRWKAQQAEKANAREAAEVERLQPLIAQTAQAGSADDIQLLVEQIQNSRTLSPEAQRHLTSPLYDRLVVLRSAASSTAVANGDLLTARMQLSDARAAFDRVVGASQGKSALTQAQAYYIEALCKGALAHAEQDMEVATSELALAHSTLSQLAETEGPAAQAAKNKVHETEQKLASMRVTLTIQQAQQAERERNLRLALYLYKDAERRGGSTDEAIDRIESEKRSPALEASASFVVPGLGQLVSGRPLPAALFFVGTVGLATTGALLTASASDKYDRYLDSPDGATADRRYAGVQGRWIGAEIAFTSALILHLWNIYDAYSDAQQFNRDHF